MVDGIRKSDPIRWIVFQHLLDQVEQLSVLRDVTTHVPLMSTKDTHDKNTLEEMFPAEEFLHLSYLTYSHLLC